MEKIERPTHGKRYRVVKDGAYLCGLRPDGLGAFTGWRK